MAIQATVLGQPGRDNAVHAVIDTGQRRIPLLFDCGENCVSELAPSEKREIQHLFFSHFHMDHIAGFDGFFRANYDRLDLPVHVWGPPGTLDVMHHRFRGFLWNLHADRPGTWIVHEIHPGHVDEASFHLHDAFASRHDERRVGRENGLIWIDSDFEVRAIELDHHGPSIAYRIDERDSQNVDPAALQASALKPGPWLEELKSGESTVIEIDGVPHVVEELRDQLLRTKTGDSFVYLTDFRSTDPILVEWLRGCDHLVCESQYLHRDFELAVKNAHMTTRLVGELCAAAEVGRATLFHLSERYDPGEWTEMLEEARACYPSVQFPRTWDF